MKKILILLGIILILLLCIFFLILPPLAERLMNRVTAAAAHSTSEHVQQLHSSLWIADLHADALLWNRDLLQRGSRGHVDIPRLIGGNVALQAFTIVSKTPFGLNFERNDDDSDMITLLAMAQRWPVRTWFSLNARALYQAQKVFALAAASHGEFTVITSKTDLRDYVARREKEPGITAGFLGVE
ncbi:MAG TPA: peptidase M19, partial [bacterium]